MTNTLIQDIIASIKQYDFQKAQTLISQLAGMDPDSPKPHIFLGIIHELQKEKGMAMRHYRAALALDGTDQVALANLYRLGDGSREPIRFE